ncbi:hypothetical protein QTP88_019980 [Uroleucon formosanum]
MNLNYKGYFSIILMAVADSNYKFSYVDIGAYDSTSNIHFPFVLVADKAFGLSEHLMTPYAGHNLTEKRSF